MPAGIYSGSKKAKYQNEKNKDKQGMLTGGQAKIAAKAPPPNKLDEKDFAVLRAEKAKGRGMGLQDEKIKPGKVMKARVGRSVTRIPLAGKATSVGSTTMKGMKFSDKAKMVDAGKINKATGKFTSMEALRESIGYRPGESTDKFNKRRMALAAAKKTASASRIGKIALGIGAAGVAAQQYLKSKMNKKKDVKKKMGGGMMKKYSIGTGPLGATKSQPLKQGRAALPSSDTELKNTINQVKAKYASLKETARDELTPMKSDRVFSKYRRPDSAKEFYADKPKSKYEGMAKEAMKNKINYHKNKKMAGGMMQKPMGYRTGTMVKARGCKLGRTRPTKIT